MYVPDVFIRFAIYREANWVHLSDDYVWALCSWNYAPCFNVFYFLVENSAKTQVHNKQYAYTDSAGNMIVITVNAYEKSAKLSLYDVLALHLSDFIQTLILQALQCLAAPYCEILLLSGNNNVSMNVIRATNICTHYIWYWLARRTC